MDQLNIYIDRLKSDEVEQIEETIDADVFDVCEKELKLEKQVVITGSAYCTKEHLVLSLNIKATASVPCSICNENFSFYVPTETLTHTVAFDEIQGAIYNYRDEIRSSILLNIPQFAECHDGDCPDRSVLSKYLKKGDSL